MNTRFAHLSAALVLAVVGVAFSAGQTPPPSLLERVEPATRAAYEKSAIRLWDGAAPKARGETPADVPMLEADGS